jgi:tetratricopeptide (TPR) repeat protein
MLKTNLEKYYLPLIKHNTFPSKKNLVIASFLLSFHYPIFGQGLETTTRIDSLYFELSNNPSNTNRIEAAISLLNTPQNISSDSAIALFTFAKNLLDNHTSNVYEGKLYRSLGMAHLFMGRQKEAIEFLEKSNAVFVKNNFENELISTYNLLGIGYRRLGLYTKSLESINSSLDLLKKHPDQEMKMNLINNKGNLMMEMGNFDEAESLFLELIDFYSKDENKYLRQLGLNYKQLGECYKKQSKSFLAQSSLEKSIEFSLKSKDLLSQADGYRVLGLLQISQGDLNEAINNLENALLIMQNNGMTIGLNSIQMSLGEAYLKKGDFVKAKNNTLKALHTAFERKSYLGLSESYFLLSEIASSEGNNKEALDYFKKGKLHSDSLLLENKQKEVNLIELNRKREENRLLEDQNRLKEEFIRQSESNFRFLILFSAILMISLFFTLFSFFKSQKSKKIIKKMNLDLEEMVAERTKKLQEKNQRLEKHAFMNSHNLRGPLMRILGLIQLYDHDLEPGAEIFSLLKKEALELEQITREINKNLEIEE